MRNALVGKPAGMAGVTLIALFAFLTLALVFGAEKAQAVATGSVKVSVVVVGGTAHASDFKLTIKKKGSSRATATGSGDTVTFSVVPGTYVITKSGKSGYGTAWSGDCSASGEVVITADTQVNCTLTNTYGSSSGGTGGTSLGRSIIDRVLR